MTRAIAILLLVGVLVASVIYNVRARQSPPPPRSSSTISDAAPLAVTTVEATAGTLKETIQTTGTVRSDRQAAISAKSPGRILDIPVREGARVSAGQVLVRLDLGDSRSQISGAEAGVDAARAQLRKAEDGKRAKQLELDSQVSQAQTGLENAKVKLQQAELGSKLTQTSSRSDTERARAAVLQAEAGVKQSEAAVDQAEKTLKRVEFLFAHGGVPRVEVEGARTQASIAQAQKEGALAALKQAQAAEGPASESGPLRDRVSRQDVDAARLGVRQAGDALQTSTRARTESLQIADRDIEAARAAVRQAEAGSQSVKTQVGGSTITSPLSGIVTELNFHAGELAQPGQPLMTIVSSGGIYVEAGLAPRYQPIVKVGMPATVTLGAGGRSYSAAVSEVLPVSDGRTTPVRITLRSRQAPWSVGTSVSVAITAAPERPQTLVPIEAIRQEAGRTVVYVAVNGRAERREVITGPESDSRVAILSGVSPGERVITRAPDTIASGSRITETPGTPGQ